MKIIFYEIKKTISSKLFCVVLILILLCNALCGLYSGYRVSGGIEDRYFIKVMEMYASDPNFIESEAQRVKENLLNQIEIYNISLSKSETPAPLIHEFNYIDDGTHTDFDLLQSFIDKRDTVQKYKETLISYIKQADINAKIKVSHLASK